MTETQEEMQMKVIQFLDDNINNLKQIVLQKQQDIASKDQQLYELNAKYMELSEHFKQLSLQHESEKQDLMDKYLKAMEKVAQISAMKEQPMIQPQTNMQNQKEFQELKLQLQGYKSESFANKARIKELEVALQTDAQKLNESYMKVYYLEQENGQLMQINKQLEQQFNSLMNSFEQFKVLQVKSQSQPLVHQQSLPQFNAQEQISEQQRYQQYLQSQAKQQYQQEQHRQEEDQSRQQSRGILNFPSESKQSQYDEETLNRELTDLVARKQLLESELSRKATKVDKRKREQQEFELDSLSDAISKIKLKLREFRYQ